MKKFISLLIICLAVLCFFSSCAMEKPLEAKYTLYGSISYDNVEVPRCDLFLYPNGNYEITLINSGTWKIAEDDSNKVILTASDPDIFSKMELEYDAKWHTLDEIKTETTNEGFNIEGTFRFRSPL